METGEQIFAMKDPELAPADLVIRARDGDAQSFEELMILHQRQVFRTAYRLLGNMEDAQDAVQEVFLRLYKYLHRFDERRQLAPWLYRLAVNVSHDIGRKRSRTIELSAENLVSAAADPQSQIDLTAERRMIAEGLKSLPDKERAAVVLRDVEGLPTKQVAEILGSTETTVRSQISRARIKLKEFRNRFVRRQS